MLLLVALSSLPSMEQRVENRGLLVVEGFYVITVVRF
ncbi:hypothetical protein Gohar_014160 [Gossypium harknessii]|uniref:Uncharacterized protein n=1 Tax=Gossypium harknessii TaxID=34285 RepID=A0A7J9H3S4_9ROSI|nr:hypothetical protein [Gossypium harknessii]MBA0804005.1 hypothetical protein [Gossypium harknessii]